MSRTLHEPPVRFLGQVLEDALEGASDMDRESMEDHVETMHLPPRRTDPVQAIPFPDERIPDASLARMIEHMESEGCSLDQVARDWGQPISLVRRCMADYQPHWGRFLARRASGM